MNLTATAENGRARIELKGTISKWRETEAEFTSKIEQLIRSGIKDVHIYINSPGGECFEANEIVNVIKKFPGKITGEGGALVARAGSSQCGNLHRYQLHIVLHACQRTFHDPSGQRRGMRESR